MASSPGVLVLGARNLGGAIATKLAADGRPVACLARSQDTRDALAEQGIAAVDGDAADPQSLREALAAAADAVGGLGAVVNAVSAARPPDDGAGFGGGPLADATVDGFEGWTAAVARQCFVFLSEGLRALGDDGGTLVQVTGGSARRARGGMGLWAAGAAATRALTHAAAQEHRGSGVHVALLIVDGTIASPKTASMIADKPADAVVEQERVADAAAYLLGQSASALTHELVLTPAGDIWTP